MITLARIFSSPDSYFAYAVQPMLHQLHAHHHGCDGAQKKYAENKEAAWQDCLNLCKTGGSRSYLETLRYANLANPFEAGSVERACGYAEQILLDQIAKQEK